MALIAAARADWPAMFLALGLALIVDAADGPLARLFDVARVLPRWNGETLDLIVDFATYVFVPAYAIAASSLLPGDFAVLAGVAIAISGALYFGDRDMKTEDNYFRGFPGVWNLVAFYLLLLQPSPWVALASVTFFVVLSFIPLHFVHPLRVRTLRVLSIALLIVWAALALVTVGDGLKPAPWVTAGLSAIALYFFIIGWLPLRR